jgi:hypothetical protein
MAKWGVDEMVLVALDGTGEVFRVRHTPSLPVT